MAYKTAVLFCNHSYRSSNSFINWRKARHHKVFIIDTLKNKTKYGKTLFRSEGKRSLSYLSIFLRPSLSCSDQLRWLQNWLRKILSKFLSIQPHDISHSVSSFFSNYPVQLPWAKRDIKNLGLCTLHTFYRIVQFKVATKLIFILIMCNAVLS